MPRLKKKEEEEPQHSYRVNQDDVNMLIFNNDFMEFKLPILKTWRIDKHIDLVFGVMKRVDYVMNF